MSQHAIVGLDKIHPHPRNPRRNAVADEDMVASIRTQGLVQALTVAPHQDVEGEYVLIAGHRRFDGLTKAGNASAEVLVRTDLVTDGQQIEAMLVENGHRTDLTAAEEADAYEQLTLEGYKPGDIATAVGKSRKTVDARLKIASLPAKARDRVHDGVMTLADATSMAEFADAPEVMAELENTLGTSNFYFSLSQARRARDNAAKWADLAQEFTARGLVELDAIDRNDLTAQQHVVYSEDADDPSRTPNAWYFDGRMGPMKVRTYSDEEWAAIVARTEERTVTAEADRQERQAQMAAEREAEAAAADVRLDHVRDHVASQKMPKPLVELIRAATPALLYSEGVATSTRAIRTACKVSDDMTDEQLLVDIPTWSDAKIVTLLGALMASAADQILGRIYDREEAQVAAPWLDYLKASGHTFCDWDNTVHQKVTGILEDTDEDDS